MPKQKTKQKKNNNNKASVCFVGQTWKTYLPEMFYL